MKVFKSLAIILLLVACLFMFGSIGAKADVVGYDADGQFLGIVISSYSQEFYLPSHEVFFQINMINGELFDKELYFESEDCSGTAYVKGVLFPNVLFENKGKYYLTENVVPIKIQANSHLYNPWPTCVTYSHNEYDMLPVNEISSPITFPVALPLNVSFEPTHPGKWKKSSR